MPVNKEEYEKLKEKLRKSFDKALCSVEFLEKVGRNDHNKNIMKQITKKIVLFSRSRENALIVISDSRPNKLLVSLLRILEKRRSFIFFIVVGETQTKNVYEPIFKKGFTGGSSTFSLVSSIDIGGKHVALKKVAKKRVLAVITAYNEEDIIKHAIGHLLENGIHVHVVDNWSTDATYNIVKKISKNDQRVRVSRWPKNRNDKDAQEFALKEVLKNETKVFKKFSEFDWFIHHDADEIRESPWSGANLQEAISLVDSYGYNAIDFSIINFRPVDDAFEQAGSLEGSFAYFEHAYTPGSQVQIKCWKNQQQEFDIVSSYGHEAKFNDRRVYPLKFLLKHYPLRSESHAKRKIAKERIPRFNHEERTSGAHWHYDGIAGQEKFLWNKDELLLFDNEFYQNSLFEKFFGVIL